MTDEGLGVTVVLEGDWRSGLELRDQRSGVAGAQPCAGGQLGGADGGAVGAELSVDPLGLGALGQHHSA
jgi:hypothetical protein